MKVSDIAGSTVSLGPSLRALSVWLRAHARVVGAVCGSIGSWISSLKGMMAIMGSGGGVLPYAVAFLLTLMVQFFLLSALGGVKAPGRRWYARIGPLSVAAFCTMISVGTAYVNYWDWLISESVAKEAHHEYTREVRSFLKTFVGQYGTITSTLEQLAAYSRKTAKRERKEGGTCADASGPTRGPRYRLRSSDADLFSAFVPGFRERRVQARKALEALKTQTAKQDASWKEAHAAARTALEQARILRQDPKLRTLRTKVRERIELGRRPIPNGSGGTFECHDATIESLGDSLLAAELPKVPSKIELFDPTDAAGVKLHAFERLVRIVNSFGDGLSLLPPSRAERREERRAVLAGEGSDQGPDTRELLPLAFAFGFDVLIWYGALASPGRRGRSHWLAGHGDGGPHSAERARRLQRFEAEARSAPGLFERLEARRLRLRELLRLRDYAWVVESPSSEDAGLRRLLELAVASGRARLLQAHVSAEELPAKARETPELEALQGRGRRLRLYRLEQGFLDELVRDAFAAAGDDAGTLEAERPHQFEAPPARNERLAATPRIVRRGPPLAPAPPGHAHPSYAGARRFACGGFR